MFYSSNYKVQSVSFKCGCRLSYLNALANSTTTCGWIKMQLEGKSLIDLLRRTVKSGWCEKISAKRKKVGVKIWVTWFETVKMFNEDHVNPV